MKYTLVIWCRDCYQEDFQGCFDGGEETDDFEDLKEAIKSAEKSIHNASQWEWEIQGATKSEINKVYEELYGYKYYLEDNL